MAGEVSALYGHTMTCLEILAKAPTNILQSNTDAYKRVSFKISIL